MARPHTLHPGRNPLLFLAIAGFSVAKEYGAVLKKVTIIPELVPRQPSPQLSALPRPQLSWPK